MKKISLYKTKNSFRILGLRGKSPLLPNRFLEGLEVRNLSKETVRSYGYDLVFLLRWLHKNKIAWKLFDQRTLVKYIKFQKEQHAEPRSINRRLTTCELYYKFCYGKKINKANQVNMSTPFYKGRGIDKKIGIFHVSKPNDIKLRVKENSPLIESLLPEEIKTFIDSISRYRDLSIVYLMLLCGLRFNEILLLKIEDINFNENLFKISGKGNKERLMPIPPVLLESIQKYLKLERPNICFSKNIFVILQGKGSGSKMTKAGLRSLFRYRRKVTGVSKANPHRFRHTFGTRMAAENVSLPMLQIMMGHADPSTTIRYIHFSTADLSKEFERAMQKIGTSYGSISVT